MTAMTLEDLNLSPHPFGFQHKELFPNGYGISIVPERDVDRYELAVLEHSHGHKAHLSYDTEITEDVLRWCTREAIWEFRNRIKNFPPRTVSVGATRQ
jgi:hypothetical protein